MNEIKKEFGKRLAEIRKSKKLNQEDFKNIIEAPTVQMISGWENGHSFPSATYLIIIAKKLDISLDYLLLGKQNSNQDKNIKTYKDAATYMTQLLDSGLFSLGGFYYGSRDDQYEVSLTSRDSHIRDFKLEFDNLAVASKTLRPELFKQALCDLLNKYDIPLKRTTNKE